MRARLDEEMGTPPADGIDVDALIARGRRQVRTRRLAAVAGGAGLAAVAVGTAVAVAVNGTGAAPDGVAVPPSAPASRSASLAPTGGVTPPGSRIAQPDPTPQNDDEKRLSGVVKDLVGTYAPGYRADRDHSGREPLEVRSARVWRNGVWTPTEPTYEASADITVRGGTGGFYLGFGRLGGAFSVAPDCADLASSDASDCAEAVGPAREKIVKVTVESAGGTAFIVYVTRTDGTGVALITDDGNEHNTKVGSLSEPVFSLDQLVKMGTDRRLTF